MWWITNQSGITYFKNTFPNLNGKEGSSVDDNITVTWFDNDNDGKLSKNDLIQIKSPFKDLIGFEFRILEKHDEGYTEISIIELN